MNDFKSEIKLFLIVAAVSAVLAVGGFLLLQYVQEQNEFRDPHEPAAIKQHIQQQVTEFLKLNINSYVQAEPVLGAPKFFVDEVEFYEDNKFIATFEDGHILGYMLGTYSTEGGNVQIQYLAETFNNEGEPSLEELKLQHGFTSEIDTSTWQIYNDNQLELKYPSGWNESVQLIGSGSIVSWDSLDNIYVLSLTRRANQFEGRKLVNSLDELLQNTVREKKYIMLDGVEAIELLPKESGSGTADQKTQSEVSFLYQSSIYTLSFESRTRDMARVRTDSGIFNQILSTFRFVEDDETKSSLEKQTIRNAEGAPILHVDVVQKAYKDWTIAHEQASEPELLFEFNNAILSPDKNKIAFSAYSIPEGGVSLSFIYYLQTEELLYLDSETAALSWWWPNSPTFWSPDSRHLVIHTVGFELENSEIIFDTEERRLISSIPNNLSMKEIIGWSSNESIDYIEQGEGDYIDITWRFDIHSAKLTKISETPYPLPTPTITMAAAQASDNGQLRFNIGVNKGWINRVRLCWAADKNGPWVKYQDFQYGNQILFTPPQFEGEKIFYRIATLAPDERGEGPTSQTIEVPTKCCWTEYFR